MSEDKKHKVIVLDPPWQYQNFSEEKHGAAKAHFECMSITDMKKVPIASWADEDCVMCMWAVWPKLPEAISLMEAYGFRYVTGIPWVKIIPEMVQEDITTELLLHALDEDWGRKKILRRIKSIVANVAIKIRRGIGFWSQSASEMVLIGVRGTPKRRDRREDTPIGLLIGEDKQFYHPIGKHSEKPEDIQDWLERKFDGPYLELYATRERTNWDCWGFNTGFKLTPEGVEAFTATSFSKTGHALTKTEEEANGSNSIKV